MLRVGIKLSTVIFLRVVPFIINLLDCTLMTLRSSSVNVRFLNVELMIWRRESLTLMNKPFCSETSQYWHMNSESDCTSITGLSILEVFLTTRPPRLTCSIDWSKKIKDDFIFVMLHKVTLERKTLESDWIESREI